MCSHESNKAQVLISIRRSTIRNTNHCLFHLVANAHLCKLAEGKKTGTRVYISIGLNFLTFNQDLAYLMNNAWTITAEFKP